MKLLHAAMCSANHKEPLNQMVIPHQGVKLSKESIRRFISENTSGNEENENMYIMNVVRDPVDTVLSGILSLLLSLDTYEQCNLLLFCFHFPGYNYHLKVRVISTFPLLSESRSRTLDTN